MRFDTFRDKVREACGYKKGRDPSFHLGVREQDLSKAVENIVREPKEGVLKKLCEAAQRHLREDRRVSYASLYLLADQARLINATESWAFLAG